MLGSRGADTPPTAGSQNLGGQDPHFASSSASNNEQTTSTSKTTSTFQSNTATAASIQLHQDSNTTTAGTASTLTYQQQQRTATDRDSVSNSNREMHWDFVVDRLSGSLHSQVGISLERTGGTGGLAASPKEGDTDGSEGGNSDDSVELVDMPSLSSQTGSDSCSDWSMVSISSSEVADLREGERQTAGEETGGEISTRVISYGGTCRQEGATPGGREEEDSDDGSLGPHLHRAASKRPMERGGGLTGRRKSFKRKESTGGGSRKKRHTHGARLKRSQRRQDKWKRAQSDDELKKKYRNFSRGAAAFAARIQVTDKDIQDAMHSSMASGVQLEQAAPAADLSGETVTAEMSELRRTMELLRDGGYGYLPQHKQSGNVRILMENFNSLGIYTIMESGQS